MARAMNSSSLGNPPATNRPMYRVVLSTAWLLMLLVPTTLEAQLLSAEAKPAPTEAQLLARGAKKLQATDFDTLYVGNTLTGATADGEAFHMFVESRTGYRMLFQGKSSSDRWSVGKQGEFCAASGNDVACTREYRVDQMVYSFNPDGSLAGTARIRPGNPEKL